jgi:putative restriction endonuclease
MNRRSTGFAANVVRGRHDDTESVEGRTLWEQVQRTLRGQAAAKAGSEPHPLLRVAEPTDAGWGAPALVKPRLGQSAFRVLVTDAYQRKCAMTGESTLVALEAAHIVPHAKEGKHDVQNGLLLRADPFARSHSPSPAMLRTTSRLAAISGAPSISATAS